MEKIAVFEDVLRKRCWVRVRMEECSRDRKTYFLSGSVSVDHRPTLYAREVRVCTVTLYCLLYTSDAADE